MNAGINVFSEAVMNDFASVYCCDTVIFLLHVTACSQFPTQWHFFDEGAI